MEEEKKMLKIGIALIVIVLGGTLTFNVVKEYRKQAAIEACGRKINITYYDIETGWGQTEVCEKQYEHESFIEKPKSFDLSPYEDLFLSVAKSRLESQVAVNSNKLKIKDTIHDPENINILNLLGQEKGYKGAMSKSYRNYINYYGHEPDEYWTFNPDDLYIKGYDYPESTMTTIEVDEFGEEHKVPVTYNIGLKGIYLGLPLSNGQEVYTYWQIDIRPGNPFGITNGKYFELSSDFSGYSEKPNFVDCKENGELWFNFMGNGFRV